MDSLDLDTPGRHRSAPAVRREREPGTGRRRRDLVLLAGVYGVLAAFNIACGLLLDTGSWQWFVAAAAAAAAIGFAVAAARTPRPPHFPGPRHAADDTDH